MNRDLPSLRNSVNDLSGIDDKERQEFLRVVEEVRKTDQQYQLLLDREERKHRSGRVKSIWVPVLLVVIALGLFLFCARALVDGHISINGPSITYLSKEPGEFWFYFAWPATIAAIFSAMAFFESKSNFFLRFNENDIHNKSKQAEIHQFLHNKKLREKRKTRRVAFFTTPFLVLIAYALFTDVIASLRSGIMSVSESHSQYKTLVDVKVEPLKYWLYICIESIGILIFVLLAFVAAWYWWRQKHPAKQRHDHRS